MNLSCDGTVPVVLKKLQNRSLISFQFCGQLLLSITFTECIESTPLFDLQFTDNIFPFLMSLLSKLPGGAYRKSDFSCRKMCRTQLTKTTLSTILVILALAIKKQETCQPKFQTHSRQFSGLYSNYSSKIFCLGINYGWDKASSNHFSTEKRHLLQ